MLEVLALRVYVIKNDISIMTLRGGEHSNLVVLVDDLEHLDSVRSNVEFGLYFKAFWCRNLKHNVWLNFRCTAHAVG